MSYNEWNKVESTGAQQCFCFQNEITYFLDTLIQKILDCENK